MTRLGIAAESVGDVQLLTHMSDRIVVEAVPWIESEVLDAYRTWCGVGEADWLDVHDAFRRARAQGLQPYGRFEGEPGALDARMHRAILLLMACGDEPPEVVVIARDPDGQEERRRGFEQAVSERDWPFEIVGALASPELEAWLVAAWTALDEADRGALAGVRARLGFDPTASPERLTARRQTDKKDAKRVLKELCTAPPDARQRWKQVAMDQRLSTAGDRCGLSAFIKGVQDKIVPVLRG